MIWNAVCSTPVGIFTGIFRDFCPVLGIDVEVALVYAIYMLGKMNEISQYIINHNVKCLAKQEVLNSACSFHEQYLG